MFRVPNDVGDKEVKFTFQHYRGLEATGLNLSNVSVCVLSVGEKKYHGIACCSRSDNFNKDTGRKVALARAIQQAFPRTELKARKAIWERYQWRTLRDGEYFGILGLNQATLTQLGLV